MCSKHDRLGSREETRRHLGGAASGHATSPTATSHNCLGLTPQPGRRVPDKLQFTVREEKTDRGEERETDKNLHRPKLCTNPDEDKKTSGEFWREKISLAVFPQKDSEGLHNTLKTKIHIFIIAFAYSDIL